MKFGKRIKERYFYDDSQSGLWFDLCPMTRGAGDQDQLAVRIGEVTAHLQSLPQATKAWLPTLFLNESQLEDLGERSINRIAPLTHLMIFKPGEILPDEVDRINVPIWSAYFTDGFQWSSNDKVYTQYTPGNLGQKFRRVEKAEVDAYGDPAPPVIIPPMVPPVVPPVVPGIPGVLTLGGEIIVHVHMHNDDA